MATVMTWSNSEGIQGRCDASCHTARLPECKCMCGGRYHGKAFEPGGMEAAIQEYHDEIITSAERRAANQGFQIRATSKRKLLKDLTKDIF